MMMPRNNYHFPKLWFSQLLWRCPQIIIIFPTILMMIIIWGHKILPNHNRSVPIIIPWGHLLLYLFDYQPSWNNHWLSLKIIIIIISHNIPWLLKVGIWHNIPSIPTSPTLPGHHEGQQPQQRAVFQHRRQLPSPRQALEGADLVRQASHVFVIVLPGGLRGGIGWNMNGYVCIHVYTVYMYMHMCIYVY